MFRKSKKRRMRKFKQEELEYVSSATNAVQIELSDFGKETTICLLTMLMVHKRNLQQKKYKAEIVEAYFFRGAFNVDVDELIFYVSMSNKHAYNLMQQVREFEDRFKQEEE